MGGGKSGRLKDVYFGSSDLERKEVPLFVATQIIIKKKYHMQLAKMSFGKIFDLTAGVYFFFSIT